MKRFVMRQNIEHFQQMLERVTDPAERRKIENLLREEEAKLKQEEAEDRKKA